MLRAQIIGNIGGDATIKTFGDKNYIAFNVAHSEKRNGQEHTQWVSVLKYGDNTSPIFNYLKKGVKVFVEGSLAVKQYSDQSGAAQVSVNVNADVIQLCSSQSEGGQQQAQQQAAPQKPQQRPQQARMVYDQPNHDTNDNGDDLPFN